MSDSASTCNCCVRVCDGDQDGRQAAQQRHVVATSIRAKGAFAVVLLIHTVNAGIAETSNFFVEGQEALMTDYHLLLVVGAPAQV